MENLAAADEARYPDLIYVVEDDPDVSQLIEHNLRTAGKSRHFFPERQ